MYDSCVLWYEQVKCVGGTAHKKNVTMEDGEEYYIMATTIVRAAVMISHLSLQRTDDDSFYLEMWPTGLWDSSQHMSSAKSSCTFIITSIFLHVIFISYPKLLYY